MHAPPQPRMGTAKEGCGMTSIEQWQPPTETEIEQLRHQAAVVANTSMVPKAFKNRPDEIVAAALLGRERGISLMTALTYVDVIDGTPQINAEGCLALVRARGHSISGKVHPDGQGVTVRGRRADTGDVMEYSWTMDMAKRAGLATKDNWKKYPESMMWARAVDQLCRMLFSDVVMGLPSPIVSDDVEDVGPFDAIADDPTQNIDTAIGDIPVEDVDDAVLVDEFDLDVFRERANSLAGEWRKHLRAELDRVGVPWGANTDQLTDNHKRLALAVLEQVEAEAKATIERRRRHAHAVCSKAGLDDDQRHALIRFATDGQTESARLLTETQLERVVECCQRIADETLVLHFDENGKPFFFPNTPIDYEATENEYGEVCF
jgi:hypothetical protein